MSAKSLYSQYIEAISDAKVKETPFGFIVYHFADTDCYIAEGFVIPEKRFTPKVSVLLDEVFQEAGQKGCVKCVCHVIPSNKNSTQSLKFLLKYGFKLIKSSDNLIRLEKGILCHPLGAF